MGQVGNLSVRIGGDASQLENEIKKVTHSLKEISNQAMISFAAMTTGLTVLGSKFVSIASDANELKNVIDTTFGSSSKSIQNWADSTANAMGRFNQDILKSAGTFGAMLKGMGTNSEDVEKISKGFAKLAVDLGSFWNVSDMQAFEDLKSLLAGSAETMYKYGIVATDTELKNYALKNSYAKLWDEMDAGEKAIVKYNFVLDKTKDAQGDAEKTIGSFANQVKVFESNVKELQKKLGDELLPTVNAVVSVLNKIDFSKIFTQDTITKIKNITAGVLGLVGSFAVVGVSLAIISNPMLQLVTVSALVVGGIEKNFLGLRDVFDGIMMQMDKMAKTWQFMQKGFNWGEAAILGDAEISLKMIQKMQNREKGAKLSKDEIDNLKMLEKAGIISTSKIYDTDLGGNKTFNQKEFNAVLVQASNYFLNNFKTDGATIAKTYAEDIKKEWDKSGAGKKIATVADDFVNTLITGIEKIGKITIKTGESIFEKITSKSDNEESRKSSGNKYEKAGVLGSKADVWYSPTDMGRYYGQMQKYSGNYLNKDGETAYTPTDMGRYYGQMQTISGNFQTEIKYFIDNLDTLSNSFTKLGSQLGSDFLKTLGSVSDSIQQIRDNNLGKISDKFGAGDIIGGISGSLGMISGVIGIFQSFANMNKADNDRKEALAKEQEEIAKKQKEAAQMLYDAAYGTGKGETLKSISNVMLEIMGKSISDQMKIKSVDIKGVGTVAADPAGMSGYSSSSLIERLRQEWIKASGFTANFISNSLQQAFSSVNFSEFKSNFNKSIQDSIRQLSISMLISEKLAPQIKALVDQVYEAFKGGGEISKEQMELVKTATNKITDDGASVFEAINKLFPAVDNVTNSMNSLNASMQNVPQGIKLAYKRFASTQGIDVSNIGMTKDIKNKDSNIIVNVSIDGQAVQNKRSSVAYG